MAEHTTSPLSRMLVCGSRDWSDRTIIEAVLRAHGPAIIVHGAARGADRIAGEIARGLGWPMEEHPADWQRHGRAAGPRRNVEMLDSGPALVIAFTIVPGGTPGTWHTITAACRRGIPVLIVTPDGHVHPPHSSTRGDPGDRDRRTPGPHDARWRSSKISDTSSAHHGARYCVTPTRVTATW